MNKRIFAGAVFMLCSTLTFAGCNASSSRQGRFDSKEYILSIDEDHDFLPNLKLSAGQKNEVEFVSSSSDIIEKTGGGVFRAKASGSAIIEARIRGQIIASCKVVVKYKLASPKNFVFKYETGVLSWDKSFVTIEGSNTYANKYIVTYSDNFREGLEGESETKRFECLENQYKFTKVGSYKVKVQALMVQSGTIVNDSDKSRYVADSEFSQEFIVNYDSMEGAENFVITPSENYQEEKATLTWLEQENALYDIYWGGFCVKENLTEARYELDYSSQGFAIAEGESKELKIVTKDKDNLAQQSQTIKMISRLKKPTLKYNNSTQNSAGRIEVEGVSEGGIEYVICDKDGKFISKQSDLSSVLESYPAGIYKISAYNKGGENQLNSSPTQMVSFAKLATPIVDVDIQSLTATVVFEGAEYVRRYRVEVNGASSVITLGEGMNSSTVYLPSFGLSAGNYTMKITALPTLESDDTIKPFTHGGEATANILNSDQCTFDFKVLEDFGEVSHYIEEGENKLKFDKIEGATGYLLSVNGQALASNKYTIDESGDKAILTIPNLKVLPVNSDKSYLFEITATCKQGDKTVGIESKTSKKIKILDIVSASDNQTNGKYTFNKVSGSDTYYYEIFRTGKDYTLGLDATPIYTNTIYSGNSITETLTGGYYKIRIWTKSTNENEYLDGDFVDESKYFEDNFSVTQTLDTPVVSYDKDSNSLTIERVEFGGGYEVYINGILNGVIDNDDGENAIYTFSPNTFTNAKTYHITVRAIGGTKYGNEIYLGSAYYSLRIVKLALPQITITERFDQFNKKVGETLQTRQIDDASGLEYYINGQKLEENDYSIEFYRANLGKTFDFGVKYLAKDDGVNLYYLDSETYTQTFERIDAPKDMEYSNGEITFVGSEQATDYHATIYLYNKNNTTYYLGFDIGSKNNKIDIEGKLQQLISQGNSTLAMFYENAYKYEIQLYSVRNGKGNGENYLLSSLAGTSLAGGEKLVVNKLSQTTLAFNKAEGKLSWSEVEENSTYDLYANGVAFATNLTSSSISLDSSLLSGLNLLQGVTFKIKANNSKYMESNFSNEIYIKKLASCKEISISDDSKATIILNESANISRVTNNGEPLEYESGESVTKVLSQNEVLNIVFVGKDSENRYYLDSESTTFTLKNFDKVVAQKQGDILSWQNVGEGQKGISENKLIYTLFVANGGHTYQYKTTNCEIDINDLQDLLGLTFDEGEISIQITASLSGGYNLSENGTGYFGSSTSEAIIIKKLSRVEGDSSVIYAEAGNVFLQKNSSKAVFTFADNWGEMGDVSFQINNLMFEGGEFQTTHQNQVTLKAGESSQYMSLIKNDGNYVLTIDQSYFASGGRYKLNLGVVANGYINSDINGIEISRLEKVTNLKLTDKGMLILVDEGNFAGNTYINGDLKHLVMLTINGKSEVKQIVKDSQINISQFEIWEDNFGAYSVEALCYDENNKIIPSSQILSLNGIKLEKLEKLEFNTNGNMIAVASEGEDIVFTGVIDGVEKNLPMTRKEGTNEFSMTLLDLAKLFDLSVDKTYEIAVTVRKEGSVDADYVKASFSIGVTDSYLFVKSEDGIKTYLVLEKKDDFTKTFRLDIDGEIWNIPVGGIPFVLPIKVGYVNYLQDEQSATNMVYSTSRGENSFLCYAIELDSLLDMLSAQKGGFSFNISRIGKNEGVVKQHNEQLVKGVRLNTIQTKQEEGDYLQVEDSVLRFGFKNETSEKDAVVKFLVDFAYNSGKNHIQKIISTKSYDLRDIGLVAGVEYTISVQAISENNNVVASIFAGDVKTLKYTIPQTLEVKGGLLSFSHDAFKNGLGGKIISFAQGTITQRELLDYLASEVITNPFYLSLAGEKTQLANAKAEVKFVKLVAGNVTGQEQSILLDIKNLIPNFKIENSSLDGVETFLDAIKYLKNSTSEQKTPQVAVLLSELASINGGIGLNKLLFDDLGREIATGSYRISLKHIGNDGNIDSDLSNAKDISINPAPAINLYYDSENSIYQAEFAPQNEQSNFILQLRDGKTSSSVVYPQIYISKNGKGNYVALCQGQDISGILNEYVSGFGINLNNIRKILSEKDIVTLPTEKELVCDMFVNEENTLSKSGQFSLCYRELVGENITFQKGKLSLGLHEIAGKVLIRYRQTGLSEEEITLNGGVELPHAGEYDYFIISLPGEIVENKVYIESSRFMIKNAYKLNSPILSTADNIFFIKLTSSDLAKREEMTLQISNNISGGRYNEINNLGGFENLDRDGISYQSGEFEGESQATKYFFTFSGNSITFDSVQPLSGEEGEKAEFLLVHEGSELVFSSLEESYKAKMLSNVDLSVEKGNIIWSACEDEINDGEVVYEVKIDYYSTSTSDTDKTDKTTQTLYTTLNKFDTDNLLDTTTAYEYKSYNISVTPLVGKLSDRSQNGVIQTLEGKYYSLKGSATFTDGSAVLRGNHAQKTISRAKQVTNAKVENGKLVFKTSEEGNIIIASRNGKSFILQGDTQINKTTDEHTFTPNTGEDNFGMEEGYTYSLTIYSYDPSGEEEGEGEKLLSKPCKIENVYKLPEITPSNYDITYGKNALGNYATFLDLSKYFENHVVGDYSCYQVVVAYKGAQSDATNQISLTKSSPRVQIDNFIELEMVAKKSNDTSKNLINSQTVAFTISSTSIYNESACQLSASFDKVAQRFNWKWLDERNEDYQFYVELLYSDGSKESAFTTDMFYAPTGIGTVSTFKISAKRIGDPANRYLFSLTTSINGVFGMDMFDGGNGSQDNPYIISSKEQFLNIANRNDGKTYFKLAESLTSLEIYQSELANGENFLISTFNGVLDGNGKTISLICDKPLKASEFTLTIVASKNAYNFTYGCALFESIGINGEVKNLNISTTLKFSASAPACVVSPIVLINQGKITGVTSQSMTFHNDSVFASGNRLYIGGLAGINRGEISNCKNTCELALNVKQINFGYAGICLVNEKKIEKCMVSGDKNFTLATKTSTIHLAGLVLTNMLAGDINICGVDSMFDVNMDKNSVVYGGGLVENQIAGSIKAGYFNGKFTKSANGTLNAGGIIYSIASGQLSNLVCPNMTFEGSGISNTITITNCYGSSSSRTLLTVAQNDNILSGQTAYAQVVLKIQYENGKYQAVLTF